jgi:outer membrane protein OmpA-like peptidoglycan-associated protein
MSKKLLSVLVISAALFATQKSAAADYTGKTGVGFGLGFAIPVGGNQFNDLADGKPAGGLWIKHHHSPKWHSEIGINRYHFNNTDLAVTLVDAAINYRLFGSDTLAYTIGLGAGPADLVAWPRSGAYAIKPKLGMEYAASEKWSFGATLEYIWASTLKGEDNTAAVAGAANGTISGPWQFISPRIGFTYYFGGGSGAAMAAAPVAAVAAPEAVKADTPEMVAPVVAKSGPVDSDGDGVVDSDDRCPGTPAATKVNDFGCAVNEKAEFKLNVQFKTGSAKIDEKAIDDLKGLADFMKKYPKTSVAIEGYTDNVGKAASNVRLSQSRATAVKDYVAKKLGVSANRISAKGFGPASPVADNATDDGRKQNRRVIGVISSGS